MNFINLGDDSYGSDAKLSITYTLANGSLVNGAAFGGYDTKGIPWSFDGAVSQSNGYYSDYKTINPALNGTGLWQFVLKNDYSMSRKAYYANIRIGLYGTPMVVITPPPTPTPNAVITMAGGLFSSGASMNKTVNLTGSLSTFTIAYDFNNNGDSTSYASDMMLTVIAPASSTKWGGYNSVVVARWSFYGSSSQAAGRYTDTRSLDTFGETTSGTGTWQILITNNYYSSLRRVSYTNIVLSVYGPNPL